MRCHRSSVNIPNPSHSPRIGQEASVVQRAAELTARVRKKALTLPAALNPMGPFFVIRAEIDERARRKPVLATADPIGQDLRAKEQKPLSLPPIAVGPVRSQIGTRIGATQFASPPQQNIHKIRLPRALCVLLSPAETAGVLAPCLGLTPLLHKRACSLTVAPG